MNNDKITLFTIGFTQKSAESFFNLLSKAGVKKLIDTRINNVSQLAGFAKKDDLKFFCSKINNIEYQHNKDFAPTTSLLDEYKKETKDWKDYESKFLDLISKREIEKSITPESLDHACLLCSEHLPHNCHRRLVAEYLKEKWKNVEIIHLIK